MPEARLNLVIYHLKNDDVNQAYKLVKDMEPVVPKEYIKPVEQGVKETLLGGVIAGYPVVDVKATLYDGSYHDVDSSELAFKLAGALATREGIKQAKPILLEPVMHLEATTPEEFMGDVIGDINSRRGRIEAMEDHRHGASHRCRVDGFNN